MIYDIYAMHAINLCSKYRMTYLRRQAGNRGISPITSNPLHEKDLTENKGLSMAIDAALQNALKGETLLHENKKQSLKKSKSRRMPRMTSNKFSSSIKLVGKELKSGAGLINELMEPAKKGVDKVLGPPIHSRSDNSDQFAFEDEEEGGEKKEFTPQTISSSNPTRRKGRHTPRTMERQSMTTGNSALDARIAAFQHSAEDGSIISGSRLTIDSSTRSLKSADSKDSFEERIAAKCKANDSNKQQDITKPPRAAESSNTTADNAFEERLRRKMSHQDSVSSTTAQSVSSYESKLQRKLSKSVSNTSSSHDAQQSLDSYESKLQRKLSKSVSNTSDSYESKLQRKLSGANNSTSSRRIDESSSTHSNAQQSLDSYESKLQRKLSKSVGASSSTARDLGKDELDDFESKVQKKLNSSSSTNVSSEKEELDDFEKKLQRKLSRSVGANSSTARDIGKADDDYESRLKKKLSSVSNNSSSVPQDQMGNTKAERSYEDRLRRKLSGGSSERQLESSSKEQAPMKRIDSFEERIQAKCRANDKKVSSKVKDNQEDEVQQTNRIKSRRSMLDEKIKMSMTKKNASNINQGKEDTSMEKSIKSRRDIFDEKLKQSATSKKKEKKSKKKSKTTDESTSKKSSSKDDEEDKERRRRKRRAKAEKVRASLKSVDSDQSKEIHTSSPGRLTIDEDKEGISEILCSGKHRPRPGMPQEGEAVSLRHISDLTIDDEDVSEPINDVSWGELDDALLTAQNMSMKVASSDAQKIQNQVRSWDDGFEEEAIAKAQHMSMKVAATDATKLQAQLLADSEGGRENQGTIVAERKARGRRGGEKKNRTKEKDIDKPRQPQLEQAQLILAAKVDKLLPIVTEYGKSKLDVLNALQETKYDEEKALALLLGL